MNKDFKCVNLCKMIIAFLLVIVIFFVGGSSSFANASSNEVLDTIKVAYYPMGNFQSGDFDKSGNIIPGTERGYLVDYLNRIKEYLRIDIEYVHYNSWQDAFLKPIDNTKANCTDNTVFAKGEYDIIAPAKQTRNRLEDDKIAFSEYSIADSFAGLFTLADKDYCFEDFELIKDLKIAVDINSSYYDALIEYLLENGLTLEEINQIVDKTFKTVADCKKALFAGNVDLVLMDALNADETFRVFGRFNPNLSYFIYNTYSDNFNENRNIFKQINLALEYIELYYPLFRFDLEDQYLKFKNLTPLTKTEKLYVKDLEYINVGYSPIMYPISYTENGVFKGVTREILDLISEYTNIRFNYIELPNNNVSQKYLEENKIEMVTGVENNKSNALTKMIISQCYLYSDKVVISRQNYSFKAHDSFTCAIATGSNTLKNEIIKKYPNAKIMITASIEESFEAVRSGKADILIQNRYAACYILAKPKYQNFSIISSEILNDNMSLAVLNLSGYREILNDSNLIRIINKAIQHLDDDQVSSILHKHIAENNYQYNFADYLYESRVVIILSLLFVVVFIIIFIIYFKNKHENIKKIKQQNEFLSDERKKAENASNAKGQFLAQMSHEIRTPLNAIMGLTQIAENDYENPDLMKDYISKIKSSSNMLLGLINDILDMSSIESNKVKINHETFSMKEMLDNLTSVFYEQALEKNITFKLKLQGEIEEKLIGDEKRTKQVLMNILSNAIKFTNSMGTVVFTVFKNSVVDNLSHIRFIIEDSGVGMTEEMQERLYLPFEQETATTFKRHGGSGLGLSISKSFVDLLGGQISCQSKKDVGTKFTIDLAFQKVIEEEKCLSKSLKALIVSDESDAEYMKSVLKHLAVESKSCCDISKTIDYIKTANIAKEKFNILFIDCCVNKNEKIELIKEIKTKFPKNHFKIFGIFYSLTKPGQELFENLIDGFLYKPIFPSTIIANICQNSEVVESKKVSYKNHFAGKRVLVAEDININFEVINKILTVFGFSVEWAMNGESAVQMYNNTPNNFYDLILLDINMPIMNGYDAAVSIRNSARPDSQTIPIYAMTANAFTEDVTKTLNSGMNGHITKPFIVNELFDILCHVLDKK